MQKEIFLIAILIFILDIVTKIIIDLNWELMSAHVIINNFFYLTKVYNYGASWNVLNGYPWILISISLIMLVILYFYQKKFKNNIRNILAFSFLYGGIIGNLVNRIYYGYVIDFLDFKIFGYNFPVFNVADMAIVMGIGLLIIAIWKKEDEN